MKSYRLIVVVFSVCLSLVVGGLAVEVGASGRSSKDRKHDDSRTDDGSGRRGSGAWSDVGEQGRLLNPRGDLNGDLLPVIVENSVAPYNKWVIWSRHNGANYDLAWSRWRGDDWQPVRWVEDAPTAGDDLDPDMAFDNLGTPYVAWWREDDGMGTVFISVYLHGHWWKPFSVTAPSLDARNPKLTVYGAGKITIEFETPVGMMLQAARFQRPLTITDDINPLGMLRLVGDAVVVGRGGVPR